MLQCCDYDVDGYSRFLARTISGGSGLKCGDYVGQHQSKHEIQFHEVQLNENYPLGRALRYVLGDALQRLCFLQCKSYFSNTRKRAIYSYTARYVVAQVWHTLKQQADK